jgi:hypothetical protein
MSRMIPNDREYCTAQEMIRMAKTPIGAPLFRSAIRTVRLINRLSKSRRVVTFSIPSLRAIPLYLFLSVSMNGHKVYSSLCVTPTVD